MKGIRVRYFYERMKDELQLKLLAGEEGLSRRIQVAEISRPGLALAGYVDFFAWRRIQVIGKVEMTYLRSLDSETRAKRIAELFLFRIPCLIVTRQYVPPRELIEEAEKAKVPLFRSPMITMRVVNRATMFLDEEFAPTISIPGNLMEVFGVGVLIRGKSGVGKSETALGLIERGHRLITDDVVRIQLREGKYVVGSGAELTRHHMEIRGLGIVNVQALFGAVCFRDNIQIDIIINLESWDPTKEYDRLGMEDEFCNILGVDVPVTTIPVREGRDVVLLVETSSLGYRLKQTGYNPAQELNMKLLQIMNKTK
jgi:HPr kinase/phosphorylase